METKETKSNKNLVIISGILLLLSVAGNIIFLGTQNTLRTERNDAVLRYDSILSVKLLAEKEIDQMKNTIADYKGKNSQLDSSLAIVETRLGESKVQIEKLTKDNAGAGALRKKVKELQKLREDCEKLVNEYIRENEKLETQNSALNKTVNTLSLEIDNLKGKLAQAKTLKICDVEIINYKVTKRSNKPTTRARKVNRIAATFDLIENPLADPGFREVFMIVYDSKNSVVGPLNNTFINKTTNKEQFYSTSKPLDYKNEALKMTINFDTEHKLSKGKYRLELFVDGILAGKKEFILK
jgi:hypothetical protein